MGDGRFGWIRRMGAHEAYHRHRANRAIHWVCIPLELFAAVKLLTLANFGRLDLALVALVLVGAIYLAADLFAGVLMVAVLLGLRFASQALTTHTGWLDALIALGVFLAAFAVQTQVGHGVYENGVDDTERNIAELKQTKNPVPIVLIFYYHLVELLFAAGYRPSLRKAVESHTRAELARMADAEARRAKP
jgi:uncharacterized membrane protein YGL010W